MVRLYTTHCPKCEVLRKKLDAAGIEYELCDDNQEIMEFCIEWEYTTVPILVTDTGAFEFADAIKWVGEQNAN